MFETIDRLNATLEGRYVVEGQVGEGGMSTVFLTEDLKHARRAALKALKPELAAVVGALSARTAE